MKPTGSLLFSFCIIFVVLLLLLVGESASSLTQSSTITHQCHSFDDLGEWRQLIAKGTNFIKVDLKWVEFEVCQKSAQVHNNDTRGCYFLTHDPVVANASYYTQFDLIAFVIDPTNRYLFNNTNFMLYISFKNNRDRYPPANLTQSGELQIQFIRNFTNLLREQNMSQITLVYDGMYLDESNHAYPWPRTYGFSPADVGVASSCLYSNKSTCKYTSLLNTMADPVPFADPSSSIVRLCKIGFSKFNASVYPWVFYEPTDQRTILGILDAYLECGLEHQPGLAISINVDPVQYTVYAGTRSGKAWNEKLFDDAKWAHSVYIQSVDSSVSFVTLYLTKDNKLVYCVSEGIVDHSVGDETFPFGSITVSPATALPVPHGSTAFALSPFQKLKTFTFQVQNNLYMFVSDFKGVSVIYIVNEHKGLSPITSFVMTNRLSESVTVVNAVLEKDLIEVQFLQGFSSFKGDQCSFYIQWWKLWFDPTGLLQPELVAEGDPVCAVYSPRSLPLPADSASISITSIAPNASIEAPYCANSTHAGLLVVSSHKNIYGGVICVDVKASSVRVCTDRHCTITQSQMQQASLADQKLHPAFNLVKLDVGTFPSLSMINLPTTGEPAVLEVHGDGYCYNSDWNNKKAYPNVCAITPVSARYVLNYNYGTLQSWANHIFQNTGLITSCDGSIYHGVYDEGSLPSAFMFVDKQNKVKMVESHSGFPVGAVDYSGCSYPVSYDGAMIDGITLPPLSLMIGGSWEISNEIIAAITPPNNYENPDYHHTGEVTLATAICDMCKKAMFNIQTRYQSDYELMQALTLKLSDMCAVGQLIVGDGTAVGCKNLILLYVPALAADMARSILSPDNCQMLGLCSGNASSIFTDDVNNQVSRRAFEQSNTKANLYTNPSNAAYEIDLDVELMDPVAASELRAGGTYSEADLILSTIHAAVKSQMKQLLGF